MSHRSPSRGVVAFLRSSINIRAIISQVGRMPGEQCLAAAVLAVAAQDAAESGEIDAEFAGSSWLQFWCDAAGADPQAWESYYLACPGKRRRRRKRAKTSGEAVR